MVAINYHFPFALEHQASLLLKWSKLLSFKIQWETTHCISWTASVSVKLFYKCIKLLIEHSKDSPAAHHTPSLPLPTESNKWMKTLPTVSTISWIKHSYLRWEFAHPHASHLGISVKVSLTNNSPKCTWLPATSRKSCDVFRALSSQGSSRNLTNINLIKIHHKIWPKTRNLHMKSIAEKTVGDIEKSHIPKQLKLPYTQTPKAFWDTVKAKHPVYFCKLKYKVTHKYPACLSWIKRSQRSLENKQQEY